jgi:hypothetical protein
MLGIEELKCDHIGCKKVATEHMVVTLGSLPLEYNLLRPMRDSGSSGAYQRRL